MGIGCRYEAGLGGVNWIGRDEGRKGNKMMMEAKVL